MFKDFKTLFLHNVHFIIYIIYVYTHTIELLNVKGKFINL